MYFVLLYLEIPEEANLGHFGCGKPPVLSSITACDLIVRMQEMKEGADGVRRWINKMRKKAAGSGDYPCLSLFLARRALLQSL